MSSSIKLKKLSVGNMCHITFITDYDYPVVTTYIVPVSSISVEVITHEGYPDSDSAKIFVNSDEYFELDEDMLKTVYEFFGCLNDQNIETENTIMKKPSVLPKNLL